MQIKVLWTKNKKYSFEYFLFIRARDGTRTRGPDLGKVVLHQLSHSRNVYVLLSTFGILLYLNIFVNSFFIFLYFSLNKKVNSTSS